MGFFLVFFPKALLNEPRYFILLYDLLLEHIKMKNLETNIWNAFHFSVSVRNLKAYVLQNLTNIFSVKIS